MPTDADIAWAAGLFEGEGCFFACDKYERKTGTTRRVTCAMLSTSDLDVLKRFQAIVGVGGFFQVKEHRKGTYKPLWRWQVQSHSGVEHVGELLRPWLGQRRTQKLDEVLATIATQNDPITCDYCGVEFVPLRKRGKRAFCSRICSARFSFGVKAPRYGNPPLAKELT